MQEVTWTVWDESAWSRVLWDVTPHPNRTWSLRVPSHQLLHHGHCSGGAGILLTLRLQGNFLLLWFCIRSCMSSFFFLVFTLDACSCCMQSLRQLRTIALDVRLATLVADGPCSSRGNTWHCSEFNRLTLAGWGVIRSLVCRWLCLQYWQALACHVGQPQA